MATLGWKMEKPSAPLWWKYDRSHTTLHSVNVVSLQKSPATFTTLVDSACVEDFLPTVIDNEDGKKDMTVTYLGLYWSIIVLKGVSPKSNLTRKVDRGHWLFMAFSIKGKVRLT